LAMFAEYPIKDCGVLTYFINFKLPTKVAGRVSTTYSLSFLSRLD